MIPHRAGLPFDGRSSIHASEPAGFLRNPAKNQKKTRAQIAIPRGNRARQLVEAVV